MSSDGPTAPEPSAIPPRRPLRPLLGVRPPSGIGLMALAMLASSMMPHGGYTPLTRKQVHDEMGDPAGVERGRVAEERRLRKAASRARQIALAKKTV